MDALIKSIADYVIRDVIDNTTSFSYIVEFEDIQQNYSFKIEKNIFDMVENELSKRKEVADVIQIADGFDVVLYTKFSPNYNKNDYLQV